MATNFPTSIDNPTNPHGSSSGGTDNLNTPSVVHGTQHQFANDAIVALETKVGINNSADTASLDYLVKQGLIPLTRGGFGQSMAIQSVASASSITTLPAGRISITGSTSSNIYGIVAPSPAAGVDCYIYNNMTSAVVYLINQSVSATAANRISMGSTVNIAIAAGHGAHLWYDTAASRWKVLAVSPIYVAQFPLSIDAAGTLSIPVATNSVSGYMSASDRLDFYLKPLATGRAKAIAYFNTAGAPAQFYTNDTFGYDETIGSLRNGLVAADSKAVAHFSSSNLIAIPDLSSASATLTLFTPLTAPSSYSVTQSAGHLYAAFGFSSTETGSGSGYFLGDSIDYQIFAYSDNSGTRTLSAVYSPANIMITGVATDVLLTWGDNSGGTEPITGYMLVRNLNGGGFVDYQDIGYTSFYVDYGGGWGGSLGYQAYPDFIATGLSSNYSAYSQDTAPDGITTIFSPTSYDIPFFDDSSGNPYVRIHSVGTSSATARVLNTSNSTFTVGTSFTEDTNTFVSGSTVTPNVFGAGANGSFWNRTYDFYNYDAPNGAYSINAINTTTTDPNDSQYYYVVLQFTGATSAAKIIRDSANSVSPTSSPYFDDGSSWAGNTTVTPSGYYLPALKSEAPSAIAAHIIKSTNSSVCRQEFKDSADSTLGARTSSSNGLADTGMASQTFNQISSSIAANNTLFLDSSGGKLSFKDGSGTVHALY